MSDSLKHKWWEFHKENPHVYDLVEQFTFDVINRGYNNYSILCLSVSAGILTLKLNVSVSLSLVIIIALITHVTSCTCIQNMTDSFALKKRGHKCL